jgi:hypothetical protein
MSDWTTRVNPEATRPYGVEEVHNVWFLPKGWPGKGPVVGLLIPECELQFAFVSPDGQPVAVVNRPPNDKSVKHWLRFVCDLARDNSFSLSLACDTAEQAETWAKRAARLLPNHERAALERMYDANTRAKAGLS